MGIIGILNGIVVKLVLFQSLVKELSPGGSALILGFVMDGYK
jgi:hypothetical protein